jgi:hypothetical protein
MASPPSILEAVCGAKRIANTLFGKAGMPKLDLNQYHYSFHVENMR